MQTNGTAFVDDIVPARVAESIVGMALHSIPSDHQHPVAMSSE